MCCCCCSHGSAEWLEQCNKNQKCHSPNPNKDSKAWCKGKSEYYFWDANFCSLANRCLSVRVYVRRASNISMNIQLSHLSIDQIKRRIHKNNLGCHHLLTYEWRFATDSTVSHHCRFHVLRVGWPFAAGSWRRRQAAPWAYPRSDFWRRRKCPPPFRHRRAL